MTYRPADWEPLAAQDPVPGDPDEVRALARHLRDVAHEIRTQTDKLRSMCSDGYWDSDAAKTFDETAQSTATKLEKVYDRYDAAASALAGYAPTLEEEQQASVGLLEQARQLRDEHHAAQSRLDADAAHPPAPDAAPRPGQADDEHAVAAYAGRLRQLQGRAEDCAERVREAARRAGDALDDVIGHDDLKDHWYDHARQWIHEHADIISKIADIAGWIATAAGLLALVVGWIPIVGQALAAVLTAIALVATLVSLVCHLALWLSGDGGLFDIAMDVVGILTLGVGRAAMGGLKASVAGLRATGKMAATAERVAPKIALRGGRSGSDVVTALTHGDLSRAAQLSGIARSSLRGMVGNEIGALNAQFGAGGVKAMVRVMEDSPRTFLPRAADLADGFRPSSYAQVFADGAHGVRDLWRARTVAWDATTSGLGQLAHHPVPAVQGLAHDIGAGLRSSWSDATGLGHLNAAEGAVAHVGGDAVSHASALAHHQYHFNTGQLLGFTGVDLGNHVLDGITQHLPTSDAGLGIKGLKDWGATPSV